MRSFAWNQVYRATWNGDHVAVKVFHSVEEKSCEHEKEIYQTTMLRHENILGFYGYDLASNSASTQMWLVTDYHPLGSLYDYLQMWPALKPQVALKLITTALNGLAHLHSDIFAHNNQVKLTLTNPLLVSISALYR